MDLRQIKTGPDDFGLMTYDPAFQNTASCRSRITFIDGDKGILRYRGYPIEQLAEKSTYLETAYLMLNGELPDDGAARRRGCSEITLHTMRAREHQEAHGRLPLRRAPDGHVHPHGRRAVDVSTRTRSTIDEAGVAAPADAPPDRQGADDRRVRVPPQHAACRTSIRTTT